MEKVYNKLVRDKIPQIIKANGEEPITRSLNSDEYKKELYRKLKEEVAEFLEDENIEELADILEVIHGILNSRQTSFEDLEKIRQAKREKRGGFEGRVFLEMVIDNE